MKVVLLQDCKGLGQKGETVEVKDGFALNSLIPQKKAVSITSGLARQMQQTKAQTVGKRAVQAELLNEIIAGFEGVEITTTRKANEKGGLYENVDAVEVAHLVNTEKKVEVPIETISGPFPIEEIGEYPIELSTGEAKATLTLQIIAE